MPSIISATTTNGLSTSADNSGSLQLATNNGTTAVTIDTSQNVGIGTSSPTRKLEVVSGTGFQNISTFRTGDATAANNVGGGFSGESSATAGSRYAYLWLDADGANFSGSDYFWISKTGNSGNADLIQQSNAAMTFQTNGSERMRLTNQGFLCVGTTTSPGGQPLFVKALPGVGGAGFQPQGNGSGAIDWYNGTGGYVASVVVNASNVSYNTTSDYRLKENIAPMTGALATVAQLKPCTYTWKVDGSNGQGFIAHELQAVVPDAVSGEKDGEQMQGVDTSYLVATLTAAIQELKAELDATKAEIQALKGVA